MIPHYVICCDELPDRKAACLTHLAERHVDARVWRGIHGSTWGVRTDREYDPGRVISPGHVGLLLGHWSLWNHLAHMMPYAGDRVAAVFEDDVVLPPDYPRQLKAVLAELHDTIPDWQFCFLGLAEPAGHRVWNKITERVGGAGSRLCRLEWPWGTHAYLVRPAALPVLIDRMAVAERNADQQLYDRVLRDNRVTWCAVVPAVVRQRTYDHDGAGRPEWGPSTLEAPARPIPEPSYAVTAVGVEPLPGGGLGMRIKNDWGSFDPDLEGRPSPRTVGLAMAYIDPYPCFYRGEFLDDPGTAARGRTVPLSTCARLNVPCHSKPAADVGLVTVRLADRLQPAVACETCKLRPAAADAAGTPQPRLPLPDGHFNPSVAVYDGKLILATRDSWGHSKVALWRLDNAKPDWTGDWAVAPVGSYASGHPDAPRLEDPRLAVWPGPDGSPRLHAVFNLPDGYPPKRVRVGYARFAADLSGIEDTVVFPSPRDRLYEKNWVPFHAGNQVRWVYDSKPLHVVLGAEASDTTVNPLPWAGGVIRGGAAPVRWCPTCHGVGLVPSPRYDGALTDCAVCRGCPPYYHFFHGCLKRPQGSVYSVGCLVFEGKPPYRVLRQTSTPLVWPDPVDQRDEVVKRFVVWPGGAVPHAGAWHLALGVNDTFCRMIRLPYKQVEAALKDVPEAGAAGASIRDTPLHTGVAAGPDR